MEKAEELDLVLDPSAASMPAGRSCFDRMLNGSPRGSVICVEVTGVIQVSTTSTAHGTALLMRVATTCGPVSRLAMEQGASVLCILDVVLAHWCAAQLS